jgi:hypothetical protein
VKEFRGVIVAVTGLLVLLGIVALAITAISDPLPRGAVDTKKGESVVAIAGAAITAVGAIVGAYFAVRTANAAREGAERAREGAERAREVQSIQLAEVSGAASREVAESALDRAAEKIEQRGLDKL